MPTCRQCKDNFPNRKMIDGKIRNISRRKFCLECSPFGSKNTRSDISEPVKPRLSKRHFVCPTCQKERFETTRNKECGTCRALKRRHQNRHRAITLLGGKCSICDYSKCLAALDFHHIDEKTKLFELSSGWHYAWSKIQKELAKCMLVCANCHREIHSKGG